jgi:GNAT superfamily N-acetyltransferase
MFDIYRRMYAELAPQWLANGCFTHAIQFYPHEKEAREATLSTGFGMAVIDALRDLTPVQASPIQTIEIRQVGPEAIETIKLLESALNRHLSSAPIWLPLLERTGRNWEKWFTDSQHALWLAYHHDEAVGYLCIESSSHNGLPVADDVTVSITGAYTVPTMRGRGIGVALLNQSLEWAQANGYQKCAVDFESANLPGSQFWLSHFQPVCYSVARRVDDRLAWAHAERSESSLW